MSSGEIPIISIIIMYENELTFLGYKCIGGSMRLKTSIISIGFWAMCKI